MRAQQFFKMVTTVTAAAAIAGCGGLPEKTDETAALSTNDLYAQARDAYESGDWSKCYRYFDVLQGRDPFGPYAQQAQLNVAYCYYRDNDTDNANQAVDRFIKLHPDHPNVDYAYYLKGLINFNDDLGLFGRFSGQDLSDRDPKSMRDSYEAFKTIVDNFPKSRYAPDAAQRMRYIVNALATHEVHAAQYYYKRGAYVAAVNRAQQALTLYQGAPATEEALHVMVQAYQALGETQLAGDTQRVLAATFPDSPYVTGKPRDGAKRPWWRLW
ncbi:outer membrane protein assembly factor BamD [Chitinasiproducens palmae]|uniref:Outer membrane protein assembly factor BamD n=1 Tax=Chitinasiproducens palmae TaxID=1770053 RepID=A0A1H2PXM1_9BURK|nr:outer membrane protein assembly factor BamD [Chitinasiproducens palmae]SDV51400.1 Beta-barrel assembly machine subunit BamD [Chitinasiproducens palmae]